MIELQQYSETEKSSEKELLIRSHQLRVKEIFETSRLIRRVRHRFPKDIVLTSHKCLGPYTGLAGSYLCLLKNLNEFLKIRFFYYYDWRTF
jgi:hypothetical protein